jgi:hypothetical protein
MKGATWLVFLFFLLGSCKNAFFYTDLYTRTNRKSTYFQREYDDIGSMSLDHLSICREIKVPIMYSTSGMIFFHRDAISNSIVEAIDSRFTISENLLKSNSFWDRNCGEIAKRNYRIRKFGRDNSENKGYSFFGEFSVVAQTTRNIDSGPVVVTAVDLGNDIHRLEYKFTAALFDNGKLIYMDSRTHWTEVISDRGEQLYYQVPQEVIDTLVKLSLEEYFKRIK